MSTEFYEDDQVLVTNEDKNRRLADLLMAEVLPKAVNKVERAESPNPGWEFTYSK